ncbi:type VII secretion protein EccB, partial [Streptomyces sp. NPDC059627]
MQTRRDHVQAYQFAVGRLATSLVTGDPGRGTSPTRRGSLGAFFGVLLVVLLCAGSGVYGLISPVRKDTWRQPGSIIVEKETGSRYLLVDGTLRPVLNYASALLLTGSAGTVRTVSGDALAAVPHGSPVGIAGAPDSLPAAADVLSGGWTRCLRPGAPGGEVLDLAPPRRLPAPGSAQTVLTGPESKLYVLWHGVKYPVPAADATLIALGLDSERRIAAPRDWLARVPTGTALAAPAVPLAGG